MGWGGGTREDSGREGGKGGVGKMCWGSLRGVQLHLVVPGVYIRAGLELSECGQETEHVKTERVKLTRPDVFVSTSVATFVGRFLVSCRGPTRRPTSGVTFHGSRALCLSENGVAWRPSMHLGWWPNRQCRTFSLEVALMSCSHQQSAPGRLRLACSPASVHGPISRRTTANAHSGVGVVSVVVVVVVSECWKGFFRKGGLFGFSRSKPRERRSPRNENFEQPPDQNNTLSALRLLMDSAQKTWKRESEKRQ